MASCSGLGVVIPEEEEELACVAQAGLGDGALAAGEDGKEQAGVNEMVESIQARAVAELGSYLSCVCMRTMFV